MFVLRHTLKCIADHRVCIYHQGSPGSLVYFFFFNSYFLCQCVLFWFLTFLLLSPSTCYPLPLNSRYIFSTREKLQQLAVVLQQHDRRDLLGRIKIGVLFDSEVTCVGMQGLEAQMISYREGGSNEVAQMACLIWPYTRISHVVFHPSSCLWMI